MAANFEQPDESAHINAITNAVDDDFIHTVKILVIHLCY